MIFNGIETYSERWEFMGGGNEGHLRHDDMRVMSYD